MKVIEPLPSAKDARIYMSIERSYLGGLRLGTSAVASGLFLSWKV